MIRMAPASTSLDQRQSFVQDACNGPLLLERINSLPWFIHQRVYQYAGYLTQYLHNKLVRPIGEVTLRLVLADCFEQNRIAMAQLLCHQYTDHWFTWEGLFVHTQPMRTIALAFNEYRSGMQTAFSISSSPDTALHPLINLVQNLTAETRPIANHLLDYVLGYQEPTHSAKYRQALLDCASGLGRLSTVKTLIPKAKSLGKACHMAATNGHTEVVELLLSKGVGATRCRAFQGAVSGGQTALVEFLHRSHPHLEPTSLAITDAIWRGYTATIWHLLQPHLSLLHCAGFKNLFEIAATYGHTDLMDFAYQNNIGSIDSGMAVTLLAENGHFEGIVRMKGGVHLLDRWVLASAAKKGQIDFVHKVLECWSHVRPTVDHSCTAALISAVESKQCAVVMVLVSVGMGLREGDLSKALVSAAADGDFALTSYLARVVGRGRAWNDALAAAKHGRRTHIVKLFQELSKEIS
ncbi:hypothetical protein BASA50_010928 [Batrachochytrium salamandrivorans]|uniref:Uncharacterized protein n=1 Tax=Batrachochytrium salamandrivorans TaxID=1357716 RepID=A0ABQ8EX71_9FUNG|nr:hypothetical protein BASA60_009927 [Batrachochytrium salamandrivorans]KAH6588065.1 hypothetical protein BASA50_010928 [Batrachochytrium salamandrivorans]KAH9267516.1 hypothetical protein BASA83_009906 [Batrachochytrium salamandrivorans]